MMAAEAGVLLKRLGLRAVAAHIGFDELASDPSGSMAAAKEFGCSYAVCPSISEEPRGRRGGVPGRRQIPSAAGATAKEHGLQFADHNHNFEFERIDGRLAYDILMEAADPDLGGIGVRRLMGTVRRRRSRCPHPGRRATDAGSCI